MLRRNQQIARELQEKGHAVGLALVHKQKELKTMVEELVLDYGPQEGDADD